MSKKNSLFDFTLILGVVVLAALLLTSWIAPQPQGVAVGGRKTGEPAPAIVAEGWVNGEPPTAEELKGKVYVVNAWFVDCRYCHQMAPELAELYEVYRDRGVVFIGLTPDPQQRLPEVERALKATGVTWPNGYGAVDTLTELEAEYFPSVWVVGRDGNIVWNRDSEISLSDAIDAALEAAAAGEAS